jgi:5-methylcytosine-specific restriction endonuclease McrA
MTGYHAQVEIVCSTCAAKAVRFVTNGQTPLYCSNPCKVGAHRKNSPSKYHAARTREYERKRIANEARVRVVVRMNAPIRPPIEPKVRLCLDCASPLPPRQRRCDPCRAEHSRLAKAKARKHCPARRADKARRKAMQRGRIAGAERFDPLEILARDGWCCHICGVKTPKRLRGTYDDRAPELDHIIPLALGGEHSRLNTACACRKCNREKADRPFGQLRLVA